MKKSVKKTTGRSLAQFENSKISNKQTVKGGSTNNGGISEIIISQ
ncbi:MAG: hypothetical protein AB8G11_13410 [Saprospiraceae bacterium]